MVTRAITRAVLVALCVAFSGLILVWFNLSRIVSNVQQVEPQLAAMASLTRPEPGSIPCPGALHINEDIIAPYVKVPQISPLLDSKPNLSSPRDYNGKILILTPVSNSGNVLQHYFSLLCTLTYPHNLISIALGEDSSNDKTYSLAVRFANQLNEVYFRRVKVFHLSDKLSKRTVSSRHDPGFQLRRRSHLAKSRNQLLMYALSDEQWVLWIDSDVKYVPPDIIQHLISADSDIAAPSCLFKTASGGFPLYDRNTWQETNNSLEFLSGKDKDFLMLEGYDKTRRKYLTDLKEEGKKVPIDGVGGCVLLVRADCHRDGLIFPPFIFDHHIETEGLGRLAKEMNLSIMGLPSVNVFHF